MTSNWEAAKLGDVANINAENTSAFTADRKIRYVDISSVSAESGIASDSLMELAYGEAPGRARRVVRAGDVLVSTVRPNLRAFAQVPAELDGQVASTGFTVLRAIPGRALPDYIWALIRTEQFVSSMVEQATGSNYPAIRPQNVSNFTVLLPPLTEQQRIVDLIGSLDEAIEAADQARQSLESLFAEALRDLVGPLPEAKNNLLSEHFQVIDCEHKTAPGTDGVPYAHSIGTAAIRGGAFVFDKAKAVSEETFVEWTERAVPSPGDVVMSREAPVGQVALVTSDTDRICLGQRTVLIRPVGNVSGDLLWALLLSGTYQDLLSDQSIGLTVQRVNVKTIKEIPLPKLTKEKQEVIAALSHSAFEAVAHRTALAESLRTLRSEMLTSLLSGDHTIPESYDELLEAVDA